MRFDELITGGLFLLGVLNLSYIALMVFGYGRLRLGLPQGVTVLVTAPIVWLSVRHNEIYSGIPILVKTALFIISFAIFLLGVWRMDSKPSSVD